MVGYSTPEAVYEEALEPGFESTSAGAGVSFSNSFGASGDQSRAVVAGQPASVVHFAQAGDMERLVEEGGLVAKDWDKQKYDGIAQDSVVVITTRKGNPEGIESFDDLLSKDVEVDHPQPVQLRRARAGTSWPSTAPSSTRASPKDQALAAVKTLLEKTVVQPGSARDALAAFTQGEGDVLLGYENEAIKAQDEGEDVDYVVPPSTILIETPIAVTKDAPSRGAGLPRLHLVRRGPGNLGRERLPPGQPEAGRPEAVPDPEGPVHDRRVRRLEQGQRRVLRRRNRLGRRHREGTRGLDERLMEGHPATLPTAPPRAGGLRLPGLGVGLGRGMVGLYLSLIVLLPLAAVVDESLTSGLGSFWDAVTGAQALAALKLTVICSLIVVAINGVFGTIIAWVLVRDEFPGKSVGQRADRPPLRAADDRRRADAAHPLRRRQPDRRRRRLHQGRGRVALCFVTLPFVVRAVQPLLMEMDREMEEAATSLGAGGFTVFRRIILPNLAPRDPRRRAARVRARAGRVRLARADLREHPLQDRGLLGLHPQPDRVRQRVRRGGGLGRPAGDLAAAADRGQPLRRCERLAEGRRGMTGRTARQVGPARRSRSATSACCCSPPSG